MRTIETKVYQYDELSLDAQSKARDWYREASAGDNYFADCVIEDAETIAELMGITFRQRDCKTVGGKTRQKPCVFWSGFWSQGDGACFEGEWSADSVKPGGVKDHAGQDTELHRIAAEFERLAKEFPQASFSVRHRGHYSHQYCTDFDFDLVPDYQDTPDPADESRIEQAEKDLTEAARDFMQWIYRQLETAYEYEQSDEAVAASIVANEYEFTANGERYLK